MPEFTPSRSDAIRDGLIRHAAMSLHGRSVVPADSAANPPAAGGDLHPSASPRRHRGTQWATAAIALILVGGVIGVTATVALNSGAPVVGATPSTSATRSATPTPTPTSTPTPTPPPSPSVDPSQSAPPTQVEDPTDPTTWMVSQAGMGPFLIGMPFPDAIILLPNARNACDRAYRSADNEFFIARWGAETDDPLDVVTWARAPGPVTAEGIGIGSSPEEVRAAYPDGLEVQRQGTYIQTGNIYFRIETGVVDEIGVTSGDIPWEFCG